MNSLQDVVSHVAEIFGVDPSEPGLEDAVRESRDDGRWSDLELSDDSDEYDAAFLARVWAKFFPDIQNPDLLTGRRAIEHAEHFGYTLCKFADPIEGAKNWLTPEQAYEVVRGDPSLIYFDPTLVFITVRVEGADDDEKRAIYLALKETYRDAFVSVINSVARIDIQGFADDDRAKERIGEIVSAVLEGEW